jgi:hypothetical protein
MTNKRFMMKYTTHPHATVVCNYGEHSACALIKVNFKHASLHEIELAINRALATAFSSLREKQAAAERAVKDV